MFLIVFLVVLLCQGSLCAGLMFWKQNRRSGAPSYVYLEKPEVTVGSSLVQNVNEFCSCTINNLLSMRQFINIGQSVVTGQWPLESEIVNILIILIYHQSVSKR